MLSQLRSKPLSPPPPTPMCARTHIHTHTPRPQVGPPCTRSQPLPTNSHFNNQLVLTPIHNHRHSNSGIYRHCSRGHRPRARPGCIPESLAAPNPSCKSRGRQENWKESLCRQIVFAGQDQVLKPTGHALGEMGGRVWGKPCEGQPRSPQLC